MDHVALIGALDFFWLRSCLILYFIFLRLCGRFLWLSLNGGLSFLLRVIPIDQPFLQKRSDHIHVCTILHIHNAILFNGEGADHISATGHTGVNRNKPGHCRYAPDKCFPVRG